MFSQPLSSQLSALRCVVAPGRRRGHQWLWSALMEPRPTALETWRAVLSFLVGFTGLAAVVAGGFAFYNSGQAARLGAAEAALDSGQLSAAFDALASPHYFAGRTRPKALMPASDARHVAVLEREEALAEAAIGAPAMPSPAARQPAFSACPDDLCRVASLAHPAHEADPRRAGLKVYAYLSARRAMALGERPSESAQRLLRRYPSFWVRAWERQIAAGGGQPTEFAPIALGGLTSELRGAVHAGWVFSGYAGLVFLLTLGATLFWWRFRRPDEQA